MFHVELRRFPHVARAFNLTEEELKARILLPWVRGAAVELDDRVWTPDRARLTIYEGPEIAAEERGLGRGWSIVTREGEDATARLIEAAGDLVPRASDLKRTLVRNPGSMPLSDAVALAGPGGRPSERLAVAEQAVWELLHEGHVTLVRSGAQVSANDWEGLLLRWETWSDLAIQLVVGPR